MLIFENQLTIIQFIIPPICFGILTTGFFFYLLMSWKFRSPLYYTITMLVFLGILFVASETLIISLGAWHHNRELSLQFHRTEQLAGAGFIFGIPFALTQFLKLNERWQRVNLCIALSGLVFFLFLIVMAYAVPDTFISMTKHKATWMIHEADYGRGKEGILYVVRDLLLAVCSVYGLVCFIIDIFLYKNITYLLYPIIGLLFALYGAIIDSIHVHTGKFFDLFSDRYFSRVSLGITIALLFFVYSVTRRFIGTAKDLETANRIISLSEEKYRFLVEGTNDCIFSLDTGFNIIRANNAVFRQLCVEPDTMRSVNLYDLFYLDDAGGGLDLQFIIERLTALMQQGKPADFKALFRFRGTLEPKEYSVRAEYINVEDRKEILVKASLMTEDTVIRYLDREEARFKIGNYLITAEEISNRLVSNLSRYLNRNEINAVKIGLREIIMNAIEHGNLNITFPEKSRSTEEGNYAAFVFSRQNDEAFRDRKVTIDYIFDSRQVAYTIQDQGNGFNYRKIIRAIEHQVDRDLLEHGRGLRIAFNIFDDVQFNKKGNRVTLVKKFR